MNIERQIMYSVYFKTTERSDSIIRHCSLFISHSLKFHTIMTDRSDFHNSSIYNLQFGGEG
ncbi:hypothetical protein D1AOALGA4SA_4615 [Olavius algarvensis Delta 1 endosymbiont]|nr:hypothetical protein D1AOALGA4SA_4615 [Olavius algarvensis Delta 1 endosymbiont]